MKITKAETVQLKIPFRDPGKGEGLFPGAWTALDFVLLRLETDTGLVGWGEAFSYFCAPSVRAMVEGAVAPLLIGRDVAERDAILDDLRQKLHIIGRYGVTMFAISAADIALHDLAAKAEGKSLAAYLGGRRHDSLPAYASLIRYGDADLVSRVAGDAAAEGYGMIKLHEIDLAHVRAGRAAIGPDVALTNDVNCNWTAERVRAVADDLRALDLLWLEEPIFPPEAVSEIAALQRETGLAMASGENLCTEHQFAQLIAAGVAYVQPSVTKIGGIAETLATRRRAAEAGLSCAHHAPYFGPGLLATVQILAAAEAEEWVEWLWIEREADLYGEALTPDRGRVAVPDGPGLGLDPDPEVMARYRVA